MGKRADGREGSYQWGCCQPTRNISYKPTGPDPGLLCIACSCCLLALRRSLAPCEAFNKVLLAEGRGSTQTLLSPDLPPNSPFLLTTLVTTVSQRTAATTYRSLGSLTASYLHAGTSSRWDWSLQRITVWSTKPCMLDGQDGLTLGR